MGYRFPRAKHKRFVFSHNRAKSISIMKSDELYRNSKSFADRGPRGPEQGEVVWLDVDGDWGKDKDGLYLPLRKDGKDGQGPN